ncbi:MAG TPA: LamG domain-containing protein [Magnetospirillaceae bacterium]|nr:LamG domain-containing protein [Magnetospirillaceae bacterium]
MKIYTRRNMLGVIGAASVGALLAKPAPAGAAQPYSARVLAKKPVAYWQFGERSGLVAHDSVNQQHNGAYKGGVALGQTGAVHSEPSTSIGLNGKDAYVEIPDSVMFSQPTSGLGLTVEAWMRPDVLTFTGETSAHYVHWLGKGTPGAFEWGFRFYSQQSPRPNRISAYIWNAAGAEGSGAYFQDVLQPGVWIHVVACYDPGDASNPNAGVSIYRDGTLRASPVKSPGARYAAYDIHAAHGAAPVRLGTRDLGSFLSGGLDDVAIYPRVLSAAEVLDNYRGA